MAFIERVESNWKLNRGARRCANSKSIENPGRKACIGKELCLFDVGFI